MDLRRNRSSRAPLGPSAWSYLGIRVSPPFASPSHARRPETWTLVSALGFPGCQSCHSCILAAFAWHLGAPGRKVLGTPGAAGFSCRFSAMGESGLQEPLSSASLCRVVRLVLLQNFQSWVPQTAPWMAKPLELLVDSQQRCFGPTRLLAPHSGSHV